MGFAPPKKISLGASGWKTLQCISFFMQAT